MSDTIRCISPIDGSLYAERAAMDEREAAAAATRAKAAQAEWAARPLYERAALVEAGVKELTRAKDEAAEELAWQMGRPVRYGGEFGGVEERAFHMAGIAEEALAPIEISGDSGLRRLIRREPHGLVLAIAPWNYPYMTAINSIVPALIAGNTVMLKPAAQTLLTGERMAAAFHKAGVPDDVFQILFVSHETTTKLIAKRAFDFINFTGSVGGGRAIEKAAAGTFTGLGLELGGKDPGYVLEDADVEAAAEALIDGAMFNSGQCCCGIERIYVAAPLFDRFIAKAVSIVEGHVLGNPLDPEITLGPMAQKRFAELVRRQVAAAVDSGAKKLIDSARFPEAGGAYLAPQILIDVDHKMELMREENFGPVVGVMKVDGDEEALDLMNDSAYGLTASLWTQDIERAERLGARLDTGTVFMNRCDYLDPSLCWTGRKNTGRRALGDRLPKPDPAEIILPQENLTMSFNANWSYPTAIRFGAGRISELGEACAATGMKRPLLVTDRTLARLPIIESALQSMAAAGLGRTVFAEVDANPTGANLEAGVAAFRAGEHDGVVAFGGGSGIDLGKAVAFMAGQTRPVWDFEDIGDWWKRANADAIAPIVAVPTTAGTGSEVGRASVITNEATAEKKIIFHPKVMPAVVIADPELTVGMPRAITAGTGMDAFAHCLEAYCSPRYHPMSQGIALEGMRLVKDNLPVAYEDPEDIEARAQMMSAAMMGAVAFQKGLGALHAISHPVGAIHHTHHGATNAVVMAPVLAFNRKAIEARIGAAAAYLGIAGGFDGFADFIDDLTGALGIPATLTGLGVEAPDIDRLTESALKDPSCGGNPIELTRENLRPLIESCF